MSAPYQSFDEFSKAFPNLKRKRRLHPITEKRLALLLKDLYPDAHTVTEPGEIPGGRSDLGFYVNNGRYAVFEIFATVSQVAQDLRHLEQSNAQARIAILTDPALDNGAIVKEYLRKRPRDPFPWIELSMILVEENTAAARKQLKRYIDEAFASSDEVPPHRTVDIVSRLASYNLDDASDPQFGVNVLTRDLIRYRRDVWDLEIVPATSSTLFLAIPKMPIEGDTRTILQTASELFNVYRWSDVNKSGPRYYAAKIFPLVRGTVRFEQKDVVVEEGEKREGTREPLFALRVNEFGEVSFATSYYTLREPFQGKFVFCLGAIVHLFWSFLCLVQEFHESIEYAGNTHVSVAMTDTENTLLGGFAEGWPDPLDRKYLWGVPGQADEVCRSPNVLVLREDVDLSMLKPKSEPEILYDVAEELARAYNQGDARCFDRETGRIPHELWPVPN